MEQEHDLSKPFERSGEWYLPTSPDARKAGHLRYESDSISLELIDGFSPMQGVIRAINPIVQYPVVCGVSHLGEAITLFDSVQRTTGLRFSSGGLRRPEAIIARTMIVGAHLDEMPLIDNLSFRIPGLEIWHGRENFQESHEKDEQSGRFTSKYTAIRYEAEKYTIHCIGADIDWSYWYHSRCDPITGVDAGVSAWITFRPREPRPLSWFFEQIDSLQILLSLLCGTSMSTNCAKIGIDRGRSAYVYRPLINHRTCDFTHPIDFFLPYSGVEKHLGQLLNNWFGLFPKIQTALQLASSAMNSSDLWLHVRFLTYMQALEGIHRGLFDGFYTTLGEYQDIEKSLRAAIPADIGPDHKASLESRIKYGNEVSLRRRLNVLSEQVSRTIRKVALGTDVGVRAKWVDTRNHFSHGATALDVGTREGQELYDTNVRLNGFIRFLIFKVLDIPDDVAEEVLTRHSRLARHMMHIALRERVETDPNFKADDLPIIAKISSEPPSSK